MASLPPTSSIPTGGDSPGSIPLTIGQVQFNSIECPEKLPIGAVEQKMAIIEMIGGGRVVQPLGIQPKEVKWSGRFWGGNVQPRVIQLRGYAVSGQEYPLIWANESWFCIVKEFIPTYNQSWICDYEITVEITRDGNGALTSTAFPTVDSQVDGVNSQIQAIVDQLAANAQAQGFGPVSIAWQDYLVVLGLLYAAQQTF